MISFLLRRPIAVFTTSFALVLLGILALLKMPTTLMPDIPIPKITVQVSYPNNSSREIEDNVTKPLRNQLLQVSDIKQIETTTKDGNAILDLQFDYGTNTDLAFIEVNEKIDAAIQLLPKDIERPRVIKASASDIPILQLAVTLKSQQKDSDFMELSAFSKNVLKKRIEQLPSVALADLSGIVNYEASVKPYSSIMESLHLTNADIKRAINQNNFELGNLTVKNGIYQYNLHFSQPLSSIQDLQNVQIKKGNQVFRLEEIAQVEGEIQQRRGLITYNGKGAILFSVIKQSNARMQELKESLNELIVEFKKEYPQLNFSVHQDQSGLLDLTISNLSSSLLIGGTLAILIMFLFLGDFKLPLIIGITVPVSLLLSFLFFYLFKISINILSLSGLIIGVGMMIDNGIIVIDNITHKVNEGISYFDACAQGTSEMISPLLSSVMTTCMIFIPLLFLDGIAGALFYDQALSVSIGLFSSLFISIFLLPVIYYRLKSNCPDRAPLPLESQKIKLFSIYYEKGLEYFFQRKKLIWGISVLFTSISVVLFFDLPTSRLPEFSYSETLVKIKWNENISIEENERRIRSLLNNLDDLESYLAEVGEQQFLLNQKDPQEISEVSLILRSESQNQISSLKKKLQKELQDYSKVSYLFLPPPNVFDYIFRSDPHQLVAKVYGKHKKNFSSEDLKEISESIIGNHLPVQTEEVLIIDIDFEKLLLYDLDYHDLIEKLKTIFNSNTIDNIRAQQEFIPIKLNSTSPYLQEAFRNSMMINKEGYYINLTDLVQLKPKTQIAEITADKAGEYLSFPLISNDKPQKVLEENQKSFKDSRVYGVRFGGTWLDTTNMTMELLLIGLIAVLILYFIMAAQFESLTQPLIVLMEIPIDIGGALLLLWIFDESLNVMAGIGLILMSGIVINDSIVKIHTINTFRKKNFPLLEAVKRAGEIRLKPIIMTSLTTILAMTPFLFIDGLGAELQVPMALTIIGGLSVGTFISLYFLPLVYYQIARNEKK